MANEIDIETLLRWTYRDELPKGKPTECPPDELHGSTWVGHYGVRIDRGHSHLGLVPGEPHPDATAVADVVDTLDTEFRFTRAQCERMLGVYCGVGARELQAIGGAPYNLRRYVIRCAVLSPLDWDVGTPQLEPIRRSFNQRPVIYGLENYETVGGGVVQELVEVCADKKGRWPLAQEPRAHIEFVEPSIGQLLEARAEYAAWHHAMTIAAGDLKNRLADYVALPPSRAAEPWFTGETVAASRTLAVAPAGSLAKIPLAPRRGVVAGPPLESAIEKLTRERKEADRRDRLKAARAGRADKQRVSGI